MIKNNGICIPRVSYHRKCVNRACHSKSKALQIIVHVIASVQVAIPGGQQLLQQFNLVGSEHTYSLALQLRIFGGREGGSWPRANRYAKEHYGKGGRGGQRATITKVTEIRKKTKTNCGSLAGSLQDLCGILAGSLQDSCGILAGHLWSSRWILDVRD